MGYMHDRPAKASTFSDGDDFGGRSFSRSVACEPLNLMALGTESEDGLERQITELTISAVDQVPNDMQQDVFIFDWQVTFRGETNTISTCHKRCESGRRYDPPVIAYH